MSERKSCFLHGDYVDVCQGCARAFSSATKGEPLPNPMSEKTIPRYGFVCRDGRCDEVPDDNAVHVRYEDVATLLEENAKLKAAVIEWVDAENAWDALPAIITDSEAEYANQVTDRCRAAEAELARLRSTLPQGQEP